MALITLYNRDKSAKFDIITDATYAFNMPCFGEDGKLYSLHRLSKGETFDDHPNAVYYDDITNLYIVPMCHREIVGDKYVNVQDIIVNFNSKIFRRVTSTDSYINLQNEYLALIENEEKVDKIKSLFSNDSNAFEMVKHLLCYRPEDLIESRTDWDDLLDYLRSLFYFTDEIESIINKK